MDSTFFAEKKKSFLKFRTFPREPFININNERKKDKITLTKAGALIIIAITIAMKDHYRYDDSAWPFCPSCCRQC